MNHNTLPTVGASALVVLPSYGEAASPVVYRVVEVRDCQLTLQAETATTGRTPGAGVPCLIGPTEGTGGARCEAVVVASTTSALIVEVARDPRQHPRFHRPYKVHLEVPDGGLDHVVGVLEDISAGGMRVHTPVPLRLDQRVFASILLADTQPLLAIAEVRGVHQGDSPDDHVARLQFTLMAPSHRARLDVLLAWPLDEPDRSSAGDEQSA